MKEQAREIMGRRKLGVCGFANRLTRHVIHAIFLNFQRSACYHRFVLYPKANEKARR